MKEWNAEGKELLEKRHQENAAEKECKEEVERRHAAQRREERERNLSSSCESSNGGKSRCIEEGEVVSLHQIVRNTLKRLDFSTDCNKFTDMVIFAIK
jgi:hypothetical protein